MNETENSVCFFLESHDLEEKYPGEVKASVVYQLSDENEISINFSATTNQKTLINMTNHAFFNLSGKVSVICTTTCSVEIDPYIAFETSIPYYERYFCEKTFSELW